MDRYDSVVSSLFVRFPSVGKAGFESGAYKPGLERMLAFDACLGYPSRALRCIHVAGTNGKGSVCSMIASSLAAAGYRVGLYTSPHLVDFRERIKIVSSSVQLIPKEEVLDFVDHWDELFDTLSLSFFEITTGMAFDWFAREEVDWAVIETGLGGRLDSTNIIVPRLSVVTSIGLDHCAQLGDTRAAIAAEKAGIFKAGVPALVGEYDSETAPVFARAATALSAPLFFADGGSVEGLPDAATLRRVDQPLSEWHGRPAPTSVATPLCSAEEMDLRGEYQGRNVRTAVAALRLLDMQPDWEAIAHTAERTSLRGRWETLRTTPLTICDIGHNPAALTLNFAQLRHMMSTGRYSDLQIVYGIMADKALADIIPLMPREATFWFVTPDTPRALNADQIARQYLEAVPEASGGHSVRAFDTVAAGLEAMERFLRPDSLVYIGGSTYVVSDAIKYYRK